MPRFRPDHVPLLRLHKQSGRAIVTLSARDYLLGPHGSPEALAAYNDLLARWLAGGRRPLEGASADAVRPARLTVDGLADAYVRYARGYYRDADGNESTEVRNIEAALKPLRGSVGSLPADEFSPLKLKGVRDEMVKLDWCRTQVNKHVNRIRGMFKWAASEELVPASVYHALQTVTALKRGRGAARESKPVGPVPDAHVEAIKSHVAPQVWALVQLQRLTGARGGELLKLRPVDIDTTGEVWVVRPAAHKTAHFGHTRTIYLGPRARAVIEPFLVGRPVDAYLFSPREANAARKAMIATKGKPRRPNQRQNPSRTTRRVRDHYDRESYRRAIARGCALAEVPTWHPHQLRHTAATAWRKQFGPDAALIMLGDKTTRMVDVYAAKDQGTALRIAAECG